MPRKKKEYSTVSIKMDKEVFELMDAYCEDTGVPKTAVIERAVSKYIKDKSLSQGYRDVEGGRGLGQVR